MNSKYPYLDPDWIPILKAWVQYPKYEPSLTNDQLAREVAYYFGKQDFLSKLEAIVKQQEKENEKQ